MWASLGQVIEMVVAVALGVAGVSTVDESAVRAPSLTALAHQTTVPASFVAPGAKIAAPDCSSAPAVLRSVDLFDTDRLHRNDPWAS